MEIASLLKQWFPRGQVGGKLPEKSEARCSDWGTPSLPAETPNPLGSQVSQGTLVLPACRVLSRSELALCCIPAPPHRVTNETAVCFLSGSLPKGMAGQLYAELNKVIRR